MWREDKCFLRENHTLSKERYLRKSWQKNSKFDKKKKIYLHLQEAQQTRNRTNTKKNTIPRNPEKFFKGAEGKKTLRNPENMEAHQTQ